MADFISFRDCTFSDQIETVTITVFTDVPCHLYCRLTHEKPRIHTAATIRRGVPFMSELRFCFVAYKDNEQLEAGDTLIHSWVKPDWPYCVTKYVYFWGYVAGIVVKSTSPLFHHHNALKVAPFTLSLVYLEPWSGAAPPPPVMHVVFWEWWGTLLPPLHLVFIEPWGTPIPPMSLTFAEPWTS